MLWTVVETGKCFGKISGWHLFTSHYLGFLEIYQQINTMEDTEMLPHKDSCEDAEIPKKRPRGRPRKDPNLKKQRAKPAFRPKVFHMTQEKLDSALEALRTPVDVPLSGCFRSAASTTNEFPLQSYNRLLKEMQNCVDKQDWGLFAKYMLRLGKRQTDDHFMSAHLRVKGFRKVFLKHRKIYGCESLQMAILGLTFDPVARKGNLLTEFAETLMKHWQQQGVYTPEEATKMFFSVL